MFWRSSYIFAFFLKKNSKLLSLLVGLPKAGKRPHCGPFSVHPLPFCNLKELNGVDCVGVAAFASFIFSPWQEMRILPTSETDYDTSLLPQKWINPEYLFDPKLRDASWKKTSVFFYKVYEVYRRLARNSPRAEANIVKACNTMHGVIRYHKIPYHTWPGELRWPEMRQWPGELQCGYSSPAKDGGAYIWAPGWSELLAFTDMP